MLPYRRNAGKRRHLDRMILWLVGVLIPAKATQAA